MTVGRSNSFDDVNASDLLVTTVTGVRDSSGGSVVDVPGGVTDLFRGSDAWWMTTGDGELWSRPDGEEWTTVAKVGDHELHCIIEFEPAAADVLVGASEATIFALGHGQLQIDESFASAPGREQWYTPWGGPPDVRSMSAGPDGRLYVNVHVGGVVRRDEGGWVDTMDIHADVHEVVAHPNRPGWVFAATARGLAVTRDHGGEWDFVTEGLHASYCRAVALTADAVFLSVSTGSRGGRAAVYRAGLDELVFERCATGLPEWFTDNVDTRCIATTDEAVFVGDPSGTLYRSDDGGSSWTTAADGFDRITGLATS